MNSLSIIAISVTAVFIVNVLLAGVVVFFERRNPASTWAWLLVLFFIPVVGFIAYMVFGRDSHREKVFYEKMNSDIDVYYHQIFDGERFGPTIKRQLETKDTGETITGEPYLDDLARLHIKSGHWMTYNNQVTRFHDGESKFEALIDDIRHAKQYIHMEYYIIRGDKIGKRIISELAKKAAQGIEVKLLYDGMGCTGLPPNFFKALTDAGGEACGFLPPFIARINYRNHRKLCIIDGIIGYIGGFNIGDEYLGFVPRYGFWRDTHLRIEGDAIDGLQIRFINDWNFTSSNKLSLIDRYFPIRQKTEGVKMQIVSSGPDTMWKNVRDGYFKMMNEAEKNIYFVTPYFVPDDSIFDALKVAALSGLDVKIIIPAHPDHFFVYWASMSYLGELLEAGVKCYQYEKGFIHSKVVLIDGKLASVGTANMDIRSFDLNFEVNAFIYDKAVAQLLEADFNNDLLDCMEITTDWYYGRSLLFKIKEAVSRLISPML